MHTPRPLLRRLAFAMQRHLRPAMAGRFQPYSYTLPDRYPWLFDFAATALGSVAAPRLLSFGCSRGDEVFALRRRFADALIKGIDIDPGNIAICNDRSRPLDDDGLYFEVAADMADEPSGLYDAIFCLAVLCHGDLTATGARRSGDLIRFADFERSVSGFARCLAPGGLLFLHTTNFRFADTASASGFEIVLEATPEQMAADILFDREGMSLPGERYFPVGFRKRSHAT
jgi:SAM-dependent methyltransferase